MKESISKLNNLYPDKIVAGLKEIDETLYSKLYEEAQKKDLTLKQYIESNGYIYNRKPFGELISEDANQLLELYPDKDVKYLYEKNTKLYYKIINHGKLKGYTLKQYLNFLGFRYDGVRESVTNKSIVEELSKIYADKVVSRLSMENQPLYSKIYNQASKEHKTLNEFIIGLGFKILEKDTKIKKKTEKQTVEEEEE